MMHMKSFRFVFILAAALVITSGCSLRFTSSKVVDGGIFRSDDAGATWQQKVLISQDKKTKTTISNVDVNGLYIAPTTTDELTITTAANGIFTSTDKGEHWTANSFGSGAVPAFSYDPKNIALRYAATGVTIRKSADSGETWTTIYTDARGEIITALAVDWYDDAKLYAGTNVGTILKSTDFGVTWSVQDRIGDQIRSFTVNPGDSRVLYLTTANKGVYKTVDGGIQWDQLKSLGSFDNANKVHDLVLIPGTPERLLLATDHGLMQSIDAGTTFIALKTLVPNNTLPVRAVAVDPTNTQTMYFSVNALIHKTTDGGTQWQTIASMPTKRRIVKLGLVPGSPVTLYAGVYRTK